MNHREHFDNVPVVKGTPFTVVRGESVPDADNEAASESCVFPSS